MTVPQIDFQFCAWASNSGWFMWMFWAVAFAFSLFFGLNAVPILASHENTKGRPRAWWIYQFWFNFVGSISGWMALAAIVRNLCLVVDASKPFTPGWSDAALFFLAFIGITGHLPFAVMSGIASIRELLAKIPGVK